MYHNTIITDKSDFVITVSVWKKNILIFFAILYFEIKFNNTVEHKRGTNRMYATFGTRKDNFDTSLIDALIQDRRSKIKYNYITYKNLHAMFSSKFDLLEIGEL